MKQYSPQEIVYCVVLINDLIENNIDCVFTDGHALNFLTSTYGKEDHDIKRRKEAELLIKDELGPQFIKGFIVYNAEAKEKLVGFGIDSDKIVTKSEYYF